MRSNCCAIAVIRPLARDNATAHTAHVSITAIQEVFDDRVQSGISVAGVPENFVLQEEIHRTSKSTDMSLSHLSTLKCHRSEPGSNPQPRAQKGTEFGAVKASIGIYTVICLQPFIPSPPLHDILAGLYTSTTGERDSCRIRTSTCRFAVQRSEVQFLRDGGHKEACNYYARHLQSVKKVVQSFDTDDAAAIQIRQELLNDETIEKEVTDIKSNFGYLPDAIIQLGKSGVELVEQINIMRTIVNKLSAVEVSTVSRWNTTLVTKPQRKVNGHQVGYLGGQTRVLLFRSIYCESLHSRSHALLHRNGVDPMLPKTRFWEELINNKSSATCSDTDSL
ncbi:hypothetical protein ANN_21006 [Periplaneta americana]|uniref:Uncharacterized protein n=1 Tax=Periplaneta americana TaxID=6978 RepID=A0ABQ8SE63_PERAM|nr:hypothetical protein ANN_21006 [Periplaneta americana]